MGYKFTAGDKVVYTNEFGVCFGVKTIKTRHIKQTADRGPVPVYVYEDMRAPWSPVEECRLVLADDDAISAHELNYKSYLQETYGFDTTPEQRASLLDTDPFEGEEL